MARETMQSIRTALTEERQRGEERLEKQREAYEARIDRIEGTLRTEREENARLRATMAVLRAALDQVEK